MRSVVILGLASKYANLNAIRGEVWTMNDWYSDSCYGCNPPCPYFRPEYVFQIHCEKDVEDTVMLARAQKYNRLMGNWRQMYNDHCNGVVATYPIKGVNREKIKIFDVMAAHREFGTWSLTSTINYMLIWAFWQGVKHVRINGAPQLNEGYSFQMPGSYLLIENLRAAGMMINNPYEFLWEQMLVGFDWKGFRKITEIYGIDRMPKVDFYSEKVKKEFDKQL